MNQKELMQEIADGKTLCGSDAATAFDMVKQDSWHFGVKLARVYLEQGDIENAKAALDSLLEEGKPFWEKYELPGWAEEEK